MIYPDRGDGRKQHYGAGKQPWDTAIERGWAPAFAAASIVKYLRRAKDEEHSLESARVYYSWLYRYATEATEIRYANPWFTAIHDLENELTDVELRRLRE